MTTSDKVALSGKPLEEITEFVRSIGLPAFRARQIHTWIYAKYADSFEPMSDLSRELRESLSQQATVPLLKLVDLEVSKDGTRKYLFELADNNLVESVLISFDDRDSISACVSSQVGCTVGCTFCATGYLGFKRNLTSQEIVDQVMAMQRESGKRVGNIVFMGQGEPLLNTDEVVKSIKTLMYSVGVGQRHITVSTSGIIPGIMRLGEERLQITLALSLHAPDELTRNAIVPINKKYPVPDLLAALREYYDRTGRRITIEYVLLADCTDSPEQARLLAELVRDLNCNINLIPYNPVWQGDRPDNSYERPSMERQLSFKKIAESTGKTVTIRLERGTDIKAACGQLHNAYSRECPKLSD
jgi:23S rRNA (adenine2503-C2)-methyltransferase